MKNENMNKFLRKNLTPSTQKFKSEFHNEEELTTMSNKMIKRVAVASLAALMTIPNIK